MPTKVEWVDRPGTRPESWNPITGCNVEGKRVKVSPGCDHCWAERMARRLAGRFGYPEAPHHFDVIGHRDRVEQPFRWRRERTAFVCSMGDLFHERVTWMDIELIFNVMVKCRQHTFLILTKRAERMHDFVSTCFPGLDQCSSHIWLGVSAENQQAADERIPLLLQTPAAVRFVSCEPLLGLIDLFDVDGNIAQSMPERSLFPADLIDWVIVGGESGPGARPMHPNWARSLRDQCQAAGVPFFFKQWGAWIPMSMDEAWKYPNIGMVESGIPQQMDPTYVRMAHIGKGQAGRELDGREWSEWPR